MTDPMLAPPVPTMNAAAALHAEVEQMLAHARQQEKRWGEIVKLREQQLALFNEAPQSAKPAEENGQA